MKSMVPIISLFVRLCTIFILAFFLIHGVAASLALEAEFAFALRALLLIVDFHGLDCVALGLVDARFEYHCVLFGCVVLFQGFSESGFDALPHFYVIL
jgi:hypothetical protein